MDPDEDLRRTFEWLGFVTNSPRVLSVLRQARKAAEASDITVLLERRNGYRKQVIAQAIDRLDRERRSFSFVTVHCSTINESLAESELFGHHRRAFSGALSERMGSFQAAQRGTVFLDDINDLPAHLQPKLLDVVQRGTVRPLVSTPRCRSTYALSPRQSAVGAPGPRGPVSGGSVYHRLHVVNLALPPLRERREDLCDLMLSLPLAIATCTNPLTASSPNSYGFCSRCRFPVMCGS